MADLLYKIGSYYLIWSTITDSPTRLFLCERSFEKDFLSFYPDMKVEMERALLMAKKFGTSSKRGMSFRELIKGNRAGPNETELTYYEIYKYYCLRKKFNGWSPYSK